MTLAVILGFSPEWAVSDQQRARCRGISRVADNKDHIEREGFVQGSLSWPGPAPMGEMMTNRCLSTLCLLITTSKQNAS